jgi:uncharacterized protein
MDAMAPELELRDAPVSAGLAELLPPRPDDVAPFFEGLREGRLTLRRCEGCGRTRGAAAPVCPHCGNGHWSWHECSGRGSVRSWVRYQRGFLEPFAQLVPYVVACVELDDGGARLFGRLATGEPSQGLPVRAFVERWADGECMLAFEAVA